MNQSTLDLVNQIILAATIILASPVLQSVIEAVKNAYTMLTKASMPALVIQIMNITISFVVAGYYGVYVIHAPYYISVIAGLLLAFGASAYHNSLQVKNSIVKANNATADSAEVVPVKQTISSETSVKVPSPVEAKFSDLVAETLTKDPTEAAVE